MSRFKRPATGSPRGAGVNYHQAPNGDDDDGDPGSLLNIKMQSQWRGIPHFDDFLVRVYEYFVGRGYTSLVLSRLLWLLQLLFMIVFGTFLIMCVDYRSLAAEGNTETVVPLTNFLSFSIKLHPFLIICFVIFFVYWLWELLSLFRRRHQWAEMRTFYEDVLHITPIMLATIEWNEVVQQIIAAQNSIRLTRIQVKLTEIDIANCIMRKDNYMIGLFAKHCFDLHVPFFPACWRAVGNCLCCRRAPDPTDPDAPSAQRALPFLTKSLEVNLRWIVLDYIFADKQKLRESILDPHKTQELVRGLKTRITMFAIANFLLSPFILLGIILNVFFQYMHELKEEPKLLGSRQWTPYARWTFRLYNELPHRFNDRLNKAVEPAQEYVNMFPTGVSGIVAKFLRFVVGSYLSVLVLLAIFIDEKVLLNVEVGGRSLLFIGTICGGVYALARIFILPPNHVFLPEPKLRAVCSNTYYFPAFWKHHAHFHSVRQELVGLFKFRMVLLAEELFSVIATPFVLRFSLYHCADNIITFVRDSTTDAPGIGNVCSHALFNFKTHGNPLFSYDWKHNGMSPPGSTRAVAPAGPGVGSTVGSSASAAFPAVTHQGHNLSSSAPLMLDEDEPMPAKMETSFLNFRAAHPNWEPDERLGTDKVLRNLADYEAQTRDSTNTQPSVLYTPSHSGALPGTEFGTSSGILQGREGVDYFQLLDQYYTDAQRTLDASQERLHGDDEYPQIHNNAAAGIGSGAGAPVPILGPTPGRARGSSLGVDPASLRRPGSLSGSQMEIPMINMKPPTSPPFVMQQSTDDLPSDS